MYAVGLAMNLGSICYPIIVGHLHLPCYIPRMLGVIPLPLLLAVQITRNITFLLMSNFSRFAMTFGSSKIVLDEQKQLDGIVKGLRKLAGVRDVQRVSHSEARPARAPLPQ